MIELLFIYTHKYSSSLPSHGKAFSSGSSLSHDYRFERREKSARGKFSARASSNGGEFLEMSIGMRKYALSGLVEFPRHAAWA